MTLGTTLHTSASLANSGTATDNLDLSAKFEGQAMYKVTAGGTVAATFGVKIECFELYSGSTYGNSSTSGRRLTWSPKPVLLQPNRSTHPWQQHLS